MSGIVSHTCDQTRPVCSCGRRWEYRVPAAWLPGGYRYTSALVIERYRALYGEHPDAECVARGSEEAR